MDKTGTVDSYEFVCGLALLSQSSLKDKAKILFDLYDSDNSQLITQEKLTVLLKTCLTSLNAMAGKGPPALEDIQKKQKEILEKYDFNKDGCISLKEF